MTSLTPGSDDPQSREAFWKNMYEGYFLVFLYYAYELTGSKEDAKDLVSEAFERVVRMNKAFPGKVEAAKYFYVTIRNACYTYLRNKSIQAARNAELAIVYPQWEERSAVLFQEAVDLKELLDQLLRSATLQEQVILKRFYYENKSIKEIAEELGTTENSIRVQKFNALKKIQAANPGWPDNLVVIMLMIMKEIGVVVN